MIHHDNKKSCRILMSSTMTRLLLDRSIQFQSIMETFPPPAHDEAFIPQDSNIGFYDVAKHIRAAYFRLENNPSFAGTIRLMSSHGQDPNGNLCYWLPWSENNIFRIELRPYGLDRNPLFFFTAALSGCSVFFEGNRDFPIVCHANAFNAPNAIKKKTQNRKRRNSQILASTCTHGRPA